MVIYEFELQEWALPTKCKQQRALAKETYVCESAETYINGINYPQESLKCNVNQKHKN